MKTCVKCNEEKDTRIFPKRGRGRSALCRPCLEEKPKTTDLVRVNAALAKVHREEADQHVMPLVGRIARVMQKEEIARIAVDVMKGTCEIIWFRRETVPIPVQS
jgi:hypothetical protein